MESNSWYSNNEKTFVKLRDVAEMLGATVSYNSKTMSADITLPNSNDAENAKVNLQNYLNEISDSMKKLDYKKLIEMSIFKDEDELIAAEKDLREDFKNLQVIQGDYVVIDIVGENSDILIAEIELQFNIIANGEQSQGIERDVLVFVKRQEAPYGLLLKDEAINIDGYSVY